MADGVVYLVGAGPGDPGCLTVRGREVLSRADVVVYDYLANHDLLECAPRKAERIFVGRHGSGVRRLEQGEINEILVDRARRGRCVVRLKGGDPFVFGRGGEEAEAVRAAGLRFEVVPGVSSAYAAAAYAGIPVTHRDWVSGVSVVTGHEAHDKRAHRVRWDRLATGGNTIVLLMGLRQMAANLARLLHAGLPRETPAVAIERASTPRQRVVEAPAEALAGRAAAAGLRPPVTVVVGEVVRLRRVLEWFERRPLFGRRVIVTRAAHQAEALIRPLVESGAEVWSCPLIEIAPPASFDALDRALENLELYDWALFTSANGVERFLARLDALSVDLRSLHRARLAAIGSETARALERRHLRVAVVAADYRAEGLLEALGREALEGRRILLPRAAGARGVLPEGLRRRGAVVEEVECYRSVLPTGAIERMRALLAEAPEIDCITFTSSSTVSNFAIVRAALGEEGASLDSARIACIGPITAETARARGLAVDVVPPEYTAAALARAVIESLGGEEVPDE